MSDPLLEARGLSAARAGVPVVHDVDLTLRRGDVLAVLGPNGAGKSTLLAALAGLIAPAGGTVDRNGRVAAALQAPALANRSARANVEAALAWWGVPRHERRERALDALASMGAAGLRDRPAAGLSGGEARRVHLARAIALEPDVLLLDEPFAGLDAPTRADLLDDAGAALTDPRRATVVVVHDRAEAWALADRVLVLLEGRPSAHGPVREVLDAPPTPEVAAFVGFSGVLREPDGSLRMLKPGHATLDASGEIGATVTRRVPVEDGVRLELQLPNGRVHAFAPLPGAQPGDTVRVRLAAGITYPPGATIARDLTPEDTVAIKLHRCRNEWVKFSGHPCWRVQKALDEQGIDYEVVKGPVRSGKRDDLERLTGQRKYPAIEFEDGSVYRAESSEMAARIRSGQLLAEAGTPGPA